MVVGFGVRKKIGFLGEFLVLSCQVLLVGVILIPDINNSYVILNFFKGILVYFWVDLDFLFISLG